MHDHDHDHDQDHHNTESHAAPRLSPGSGSGGGDHAAPGRPADPPLFGGPGYWTDEPLAGGGEDEQPPTHQQPAPPVAPRNPASGGAALPRYLRPLVDCGALEEAELQQIGHRTARVTFEGEDGREHSFALAHLAPDALATIQRRAGAGHITGTITPTTGEPLNFALFIERQEGDPEQDQDQEPETVRALRDQLARLERQLTTREKTELERIGEQMALDALAKHMNPPDPIEQLERMLAQVSRMAELPAKIKGQFGPLADILAPAVQATIENPEAGGIGKMLLDTVAGYLQDPAALIRAFQALRGGSVPVEETFVDTESA